MWRVQNMTPGFKGGNFRKEMDSCNRWCDPPPRRRGSERHGPSLGLLNTKEGTTESLDRYLRRLCKYLFMNRWVFKSLLKELKHFQIWLQVLHLNFTTYYSFGLLCSLLAWYIIVPVFYDRTVVIVINWSWGDFVLLSVYLDGRMDGWNFKRRK